MLLDIRFYTFYPGKLQAFLKMFKEEGLALQTKYCGNLVFYSTTETGALNQVIQVWAYQDAADRDARRAALWQDPAWLTFGEKALPFIQHQENRLAKTTDFSPMNWAQLNEETK